MWLFPPSSVRHGTPLSFTSIKLRILNQPRDSRVFKIKISYAKLLKLNTNTKKGAWEALAHTLGRPLRPKNQRRMGWRRIIRWPWYFFIAPLLLLGFLQRSFLFSSLFHFLFLFYFPTFQFDSVFCFVVARSLEKPSFHSLPNRQTAVQNASNLKLDRIMMQHAVLSFIPRIFPLSALVCLVHPFPVVSPGINVSRRRRSRGFGGCQCNSCMLLEFSLHCCASWQLIAIVTFRIVLPTVSSPCQAVRLHKNCIANKTGFCFIMRAFRTIYEMCFVLFVVFLTSQKTAGELGAKKSKSGGIFHSFFSPVRASSPEFPHAHTTSCIAPDDLRVQITQESRKERKCVCLVHLNVFRGWKWKLRSQAIVAKERSEARRGRSAFW